MNIKTVDLESRVDRELLPVLKSMQGWHISAMDEIPEVRKRLLENQVNILDMSIGKNVVIYDRYIPSDGHTVRIRVYEPKKREKTLPAIIYFRGSGFIIGNVEQYDAPCTELCIQADCVLISVDYRLAPQFTYPAAINDAYDVLIWVAKNGLELGIDASNIALMGVSAGGGLVVSTALMVRDQGGPDIALLLPLYPMLDYRNDGCSNNEILDERVWNREKNGWGWKAYLKDWKGPVPAYASPAGADTYSGIPSIFTFIGELDPLRDETFRFVQRLVSDGIPVEFHFFPGCFHSFEIRAPKADVSMRAKEMTVSAIRRVLHVKK